MTMGYNWLYGEEMNTHYMTTYISLHPNLYPGLTMASYFISENLERLFLPDYMPTNLDILHCRLKTTGITETVLQLGQLSYRYAIR